MAETLALFGITTFCWMSGLAVLLYHRHATEPDTAGSLPDRYVQPPGPLSRTRFVRTF